MNTPSPYHCIPTNQYDYLTTSTHGRIINQNHNLKQQQQHPVGMLPRPDVNVVCEALRYIVEVSYPAFVDDFVDYSLV